MTFAINFFSELFNIILLMTGLLKGKIFFNAKFLYNGKKLLSQPEFLRAPVFPGNLWFKSLKSALIWLFILLYQNRSHD